MIETREDYLAWLKEVPADITEDRMWRTLVYRFALFLADDAWDDLEALGQERRTWHVASQLGRSLDSISTNFSEGYGKWSVRDRVRFYEYAMTSARESRNWYFKARRVLGNKRSNLQISGVTQVIKMLTAILDRERQRAQGSPPQHRSTLQRRP